MASCEFLDELARRRARAVIGNNDLPWRHALPRHACQHGGQRIRTLIAGDREPDPQTRS
jgi:hypothetical protein